MRTKWWRPRRQSETPNPLAPAHDGVPGAASPPSSGRSELAGAATDGTQASADAAGGSLSTRAGRRSLGLDSHKTEKPARSKHQFRPSIQNQVEHFCSGIKLARRVTVKLFKRLDNSVGYARAGDEDGKP